MKGKRFSILNIHTSQYNNMYMFLSNELTFKPYVYYNKKNTKPLKFAGHYCLSFAWGWFVFLVILFIHHYSLRFVWAVVRVLSGFVVDHYCLRFALGVVLLVFGDFIVGHWCLGFKVVFLVVVRYIVNHYCLLLQSIAQRLLHFFR